MATKKYKAVYLGGGGVPYTELEGSSAEEVKQKAVSAGINPVNLYGEGFKPISEVTYQPALTFLSGSSGATSLSPTATTKKTTTTPTTTSSALKQLSVNSQLSDVLQGSPSSGSLSSYLANQNQGVSQAQPTTPKATTQPVATQPMSKAVSYTEGGYYKDPSSSTVYQYTGGQLRPIESEAVYRQLTGATEGQATNWNLVQEVSAVDKSKIGAMLTGVSPTTTTTTPPTTTTTPQPTTEYTEGGYYKDPSSNTVYAYMAGQFRPIESEAVYRGMEGNVVGQETDWSKVQEIEAIPKDKIGPMVTEVGTQVQKTGSDVLIGEGDKKYYTDENGNIVEIKDDAELNELKSKGLVGDTTKTMTQDEQNLVTLISDLGTKTQSDIKVADLLTAGFDADSAAKIIATVNEQMPEWSTEYEKIKSEYQSKIDAAEAKVNEAENNLITKIEQSQSLVDTFNSYYTSGGLDTIQTQINDLDTQIDTKIKARDNEVLDIRGQVIPQWMITGDKALAIQRYADEINQLTTQRNNLADNYNTAWTKIVTQVGLAQEDLRADAENLAQIVDVYQGDLDAVNKKLVEALESGEIEYTENKEEILNQIKAGLAPTLSTLATQAAQAKLTGTTTTIGSDTIGYYQYNPTNGTWTQIIEGTGKEVSISDVEKISAEQVRGWLSTTPTDDNGKPLTDAEIATEILAYGLDPDDFGYSVKDIYEKETSAEKQLAKQWLSAYTASRESKFGKDRVIAEYLNVNGITYPASSIDKKVEQVSDTGIAGLIFFAKENFTDSSGKIYKKGDVIFSMLVESTE